MRTSSAPYPGATDVVAGQRVSLRWLDAYQPVGWGPVTSALPNRVASVPPMLASAGIGTATDGGNSAAAAEAVASPWSWSKSPLPWAIVAVVLGLAILHFVHWRPIKG